MSLCWSPLQVLLPPVVACIEDTFYKITSEALLVAQQLVRVMRPQEQTAAAGGFDPKPFVREVRGSLLSFYCLLFSSIFCFYYLHPEGREMLVPDRFLFDIKLD